MSPNHRHEPGTRFITAFATMALALAPWASQTVLAHPGNPGIHAKPQAGKQVPSSFDIVHARVHVQDNVLVFDMKVSADAGAIKPAATGKFAGSEVYSYVWPTKLDSAAVGFDQEAGILAFAVTAHPDFDDTPLYDENRDGKLDNDGDLWHSHWVVLVPDDACGPKALKVKDIPAGTTPRLPATWPGVPLLIDSPGYSPVFDADSVSVRVPLAAVGAVKGVAYDGVAAGLRVNASVHEPLLCVVNVWDVASGDLSLPGKID